MRCSQSARCLVLACWSMVAAVGCGSGQTNGLMSHQAEALNQNDFIGSDNNRFFWHVEWLSGPPVATTEASARLLFHNVNGEPANAVVIESLKVIMSCCRESAEPPQVQSEAGINPAERDVGGIKATKSGGWELDIKAAIDGFEADTAVWKFNVGAP